MFGGFEAVISPAREREWFARLSLAPSVPWTRGEQQLFIQR